MRLLPADIPLTSVVPDWFQQCFEVVRPDPLCNVSSCGMSHCGARGTVFVRSSAFDPFLFYGLMYSHTACGCI